ncbi:DUF692 domain-containing protein [Mesorhizobium sp. M1C.F.Ca.ET.193.01.1.1]|uniref:MNIO family bufferin maturase n=1 Tax=unclassified Mesorhizobium TaxID=325217 RepID=UPI000FD5F1F2|nr:MULTISPECIES: DUF692 domain-containing protein [unclassified Mesorhizobium]TGT00111.1 DUF692 domain-containing protein [bacterium M00.F.Ca.ET.177.01.1.1]TGQ53506.1 DUF692 domain-containing protein [Mesorhizobium sp. M1C.F.Ca.ET.210.01.1.1]TGQ70773.1 DUF692 domain-containing protein [Mesorhizobium sp. M1C.F.Ca.ET.212.01.1.1]TGR07347.1 DUF692 domain-containing protein [Mesorhizobium sp. M1C.F.Ca.ET.204.01.1.1]TGR28220.1 DUF692 domain-containing protein [Mesorhizobium sp. M1C.F.Ca.ET.196.01.1.
MPTKFSPFTIPESAGIGLRSPHIAEMLTRRPSAGWLEVHAENYMGDGAGVEALERLRQIYPLSVHGVGLSLGSAQGLDRDHLEKLRKVCERFQPDLVSEHLAWSVADGAYLNDLLPLRYDEEALAIVARNVETVQDALKRQVLIENLSAYLAFADSSMNEAEFLAELAARTGCGLLLDVNNVHVSAHNLQYDAKAFIDALPADAIGEIHLAGHATNRVGADTVLIDDHGSRVPPVVWTLYRHAIERLGPRPTLIEWDTDVPILDVLLGEAMWADMLTASIMFNRKQAARQSQPTEARSTPICLAVESETTTSMPVLAAFAAARCARPSMSAVLPSIEEEYHAAA